MNSYAYNKCYFLKKVVKMSSQIFLYSGVGAGPFCTSALENQLTNLLDPRFHAVKRIQSFPNCLADPSSISAVFVPGGNAVTMFSNITNDAKLSLKELFNKYHSSYYGACAGGILASSGCFETMFVSVRNDLQYIKKESYPLLEIFPGKVVAPLFERPASAKLSVTDFRQLSIHSVKAANQAFLSAHILSPGYLNVEAIEGAEILSTYDTLLPIRCAAGRGEQGPLLESSISESLYYQSDASRMILTGSHPEVSSGAIRSETFKIAFGATNQQQNDIAVKMEADDVNREIMLRDYFIRIGLNCR